MIMLAFAIDDLKVGETVVWEGANIVLKNDVKFGHKIAIVNIDTGINILKYNESIGSASVDIRKGEHVHIHNMKSDFISTFIIE